jgi:hypothetical protein
MEDEVEGTRGSRGAMLRRFERWTDEEDQHVSALSLDASLVQPLAS